MASAIKSALPSRLKGESKDEDNNGFEGRHHGKTRSHMVCDHLLLSFTAASIKPSLSFTLCL